MIDVIIFFGSSIKSSERLYKRANAISLGNVFLLYYALIL